MRLERDRPPIFAYHGQVDRSHLVMDVIDRVAGLGPQAAFLRQEAEK